MENKGLENLRKSEIGIMYNLAVHRTACTSWPVTAVVGVDASRHANVADSAALYLKKSGQ